MTVGLKRKAGTDAGAASNRMSAVTAVASGAAVLVHLAILNMAASSGNEAAFLVALVAPAALDLATSRRSGRGKWWLGFFWLLWSTHPAFLLFNFAVGEGLLAYQALTRRIVAAGNATPHRGRAWTSISRLIRPNSKSR